jgi:hypothetical protein
MFQASLLARASVLVGLHLADIGCISGERAAYQCEPASRTADQTYMEGKDNEKMVIVDNARPAEPAAVGLRL